MTWSKLEASSPDIAAFAGEQFASHIALIGTIRRDGSPRISCIDPFIMDGDLYLGMMWHSRKAI
ncbi:MAG: hypothetical protein ACRDFX_10420 [Chloroflexota bacterium]